MTPELAGQRHAADGIDVPGPSGPYYAEVLLGYLEAASQAGRSVLVQATAGSREPTLRAPPRSTSVQGDGIATERMGEP